MVLGAGATGMDAGVSPGARVGDVVRSRDGLRWRVTGLRYVRGARRPYLIEAIGEDSGLPIAFGSDELEFDNHNEREGR